MSVHPDPDSKQQEEGGMFLRWNNVTYDVPDGGSKEKGATKRILHPIFGSVAPGEMLAIMGPSGCGKSSLINILAQRRRGEDSVAGTIQVNGKDIEPNEFSRMTGYVTQDFIFFEHLTVRETLTISASLRLPRTWTKAQKMQRVDDLLRDLDLAKTADTMVGSPVATGASAGAGGISGGERRRLCMAMELMNNAPLLFLDEPTSGLDSASALMVVNVLKNLAAQGKTIVCVIHQPRASILPLFTRVLLLGAGKTVYYGPSCNFGAESDPMRDFFSKAGHACPAFENPADFILDIINTTTTGPGEAAADGGATSGEAAVEEGVAMVAGADDTRNAVVDDLATAYAASALPGEMLALLAEGEGKTMPVISGVDTGRRYATSWCNQFAVLGVRTFKLKFRDPMSFWTVIGGIISMGLLMGSIYFNLEPGDVRNRVAGMSMYIAFMSFMTFDILMLWPAERSIYLRDQISGMYCTSAFYIARSFAEAPTHMLCGIIGALFTHYMYGLQNDLEHVGMYCFISVITVMSASSILMWVSSLAKNFEQSNQLLMPIILPCMFFSGFFISEDMIPAMWAWVPDVNFLYYSTNYAIVHEIQGVEGGCTCALLGSLDCEVAAINCAIDTDGHDFAAAAATQKSCAETAAELSAEEQLVECNAVLTAYGFDPNMKFSSFIYCHIWTNVLFRALSYLGLRFCWTGQTFKQRLEV
jgi:ATP-binding cassette subfamily G (WHITE) protein 2